MFLLFIYITDLHENNIKFQIDQILHPNDDTLWNNLNIFQTKYDSFFLFVWF